MINVEVRGKKGTRNAFFYVIANDLKEAIDLAEESIEKGYTTSIGKRVDRITSLKVLDDDVVMPKTINNVKKKTK